MTIRALIDITARLEAGMPTWPGSVGFHLSRSLTMDRDSVNVSRIDMDVHTGTHLEAPLHFIEGGHDMDGFPLSLFIGPAQVISVPDALAIAAADLEHAGVSAGSERLLIRTRNSDGWQHQPFRDDYVALLPDAATWIVQHRIRLLGIDYLSVQRYGDDPETHRILMRGGVAILEGLDLGLAKPGTYRLHALPIYLANSEAAPVRAVLEPLP